jgi:hypothetical protein
MPNTDNDQISRKSKAKAPKNAFNGSVLKPIINHKTPRSIKKIISWAVKS